MIALLLVLAAFVGADSVHIRINLLGYLADESKVAVVLAPDEVAGGFEVIDAATGTVALRGPIVRSLAEPWAPFTHYYDADFSELDTPGRYVLRVGTAQSPDFTVGPAAYAGAHEDLLGFMRQQRCGYNPYLDRVCHQRDGRSFYGPMADSTFVDATGGWHDAGDQLKYLITGSNATADMLLAHELAPDVFADAVNALGQPGSNGLPDVLDEARWGLDWILRLAAVPGALIHQVADDRDHKGFKMPDEDNAEYGWGKNSYRPAYFANGEPQGLREWKSEATGVANLAGRSAAALAMASRVMFGAAHDTLFALQAARVARDLYALGRENEGYQQGNSYGAPYRYNENTWADDMEWGAAELYRLTGKRSYLDDAIRYARLAGATSWMQRDRMEHYELYPFLNVGHYALYPLVDEALRDTLAGYYRDGIERAMTRGGMNPYGIGVPFLWCSNNLASALILQIILYERMTGDERYHAFMLRQRDWLLGLNPWGTSMFTGLPRDGETPLDVHTAIWSILRADVPGGLVDGPIAAETWKGLLGIALLQPDEFAHLQPSHVYYHDDIGDYATNEPTMDGTAGAIAWMAWFAR